MIVMRFIPTIYETRLAGSTCDSIRRRWVVWFDPVFMKVNGQRPVDSEPVDLSPFNSAPFESWSSHQLKFLLV
jgi:hypothetical protein